MDTAPQGFAAFGFAPAVQRGVEDAGFSEPRPIQAEVVPRALAGEDVLGLARTGTGKTAAFALPVLQRLAVSGPAERPLALVLAPTRELALQIHGEFERLGVHVGARVLAVFGGVKPAAQRAALAEGVDVIVACTGRLLDFVRAGDCDIGGIEFLILDEADRLLDMGFLPDVRRVLDVVPVERQTMFFSATMPEEVQALAQRVLRNPAIIDLGRSKPPETIDHSLHPVRATAKTKLLRALVEADVEPDGEAGGELSTIIFVRTKQRAKHVAFQLEKRGHSVTLLHGDKKQAARGRALDGFRDGTFRILVATDLASRGLDIDDVGMVLNYDVPTDADTYVHRIGRTGRSEKAGIAVTIATQADRELVRAIEVRIGARIARRYLDSFAVLDLDELAEEREAHRPNYRRGGRRRGRR